MPPVRIIPAACIRLFDVPPTIANRSQFHSAGRRPPFARPSHRLNRPATIEGSGSVTCCRRSHNAPADDVGAFLTPLRICFRRRPRRDVRQNPGPRHSYGRFRHLPASFRQRARARPCRLRSACGEGGWLNGPICPAWWSSRPAMLPMAIWRPMPRWCWRRRHGKTARSCRADCGKLREDDLIE